MAKLTLILVNPENVAFMQKVAEFNEGTVNEGAVTVSVTAPKLVIKREWAKEIFGWSKAEADFKWSALLRNHSGKVLKFTDDEIVIAGEA
jgi:hypothetical protein